MATGAELNADGSSKLAASDYQQLVSRIQDWVQDVVPAAETTVVVSRGDEELLELGARPAWHFPRLPDGRYAGEYPADSAAAIAQLEDVRSEGASYFVLPSTAFWWLEYYEDLGRHLDENYEMVVSSDDCRIYRLLEEGSYAADRGLIGASRIPIASRSNARMLSHFLDDILPSGARAAVLSGPSAPLPPGTEPWQPPQRVVVDSQALDRELAAVATRGVEFLVIPSPAFEWLSAHPAVREALRRRHRLVTRQEHICEIYELTAIPAEPQPTVASAPPPDTASAEPPPRKRSLLERLGVRPAHSNGH